MELNEITNLDNLDPNNPIVHGYDWVIKDGIKDQPLNIHCWCLNQQSESCLLRFTNFPAFCQIELPTLIQGNRRKHWSDTDARKFIYLLNKNLMWKLKTDEDVIMKSHFSFRPKLYYFRREDQKYPMILVFFRTIKDMVACKWYLQNAMKTESWGYIYCKVWETNISAVLKLLTARKTRVSQWFTANAKEILEPKKISTAKHEYIVSDYTTMLPISAKLTQKWATKPGILAFDIECYSHNHRAMPMALNALDVAYLISCIYQRRTDNKTRVRYAIIMGDCNQIPKEKLDHCIIINVSTEMELIEAFAKVTLETDPEIVTGYNILSFDNYYLDNRIKRVLENWPVMGRIKGEKSVMSSKNWKSGAYGYQSINILMMEGRITIDPYVIIKRDFKLDTYKLDFVARKFIGKKKHDEVSIIQTFEIYERSRAAELRLKTLLELKVSGPEINEAYEENEAAKVEMTKVVEYCIQDSELVVDLFEALNIWVSLVEMSNIVGTTIVELFTRGQQVRCVSQLFTLASKLGYVLDARDVPGFKFSGGYVFEPIPGLYDQIICLDFSSLYPSIIQAYNICYTTLVPPELMSYVADEDCHIIEFEQEETDDRPEVIDPNVEIDLEAEVEKEVLQEVNKRKKKEKKVVIKQYRFKFYKHREGLLPQLVRNLVRERREVQAMMKDIKPALQVLEQTENIRIALEEFETGLIKPDVPGILINDIKEMCTRKPPAPPSVISRAKRALILSELFDHEYLLTKHKKIAGTEDDYSQELKDFELRVKDSHQIVLEEIKANKFERLQKIGECKLEIDVLDKRQLALKVSANSFFGFLGVHEGGMMPLIEAAMSITATGRRLIGEVRVYIEQNYGGVQVAGDTDSVMMHLPFLKDNKDCNYWGNRLAQEITGIKHGAKDCDGKVWPEGRPGLFPPPLGMEFEKAMRLLVLKKKKYAALLVGKNGNFKLEEVKDTDGNVTGHKLIILKRGIVLARRDNSPLLRKTYTKILDLTLNRGRFDDAMDILIDAVQELVSGRVPIEDLVTIRELGANYKSDSFFMKIFGDNLRKAGKDVKPGDRLDFVVVKSDNAKLLGHKMRLLDQYFASLDTDKPEQIDYEYYLGKALMNPIDQLFEVGFKEIISSLKGVNYRHTNRHKVIYLDQPVKIMLFLIQKGIDLEEWRKCIRFNATKVYNPLPKVIKLNVESKGIMPKAIAGRKSEEEGKANSPKVNLPKINARKS